MKGELEKALEDYNRALEINPRYVIALSNRAGAWSRLREYDKAIEDCNRAIEYGPADSDSETYFFRATAWHGKGQIDKALADLGKAIELNPEYGAA